MLWFTIAHSFGPKRNSPGDAKSKRSSQMAGFVLGEFRNSFKRCDDNESSWWWGSSILEVGRVVVYPIHNPGQINSDRKHEFFSPPNGWWIIRDHPLNFREILAPKVFFHGSRFSVRISGISRGGRVPIFRLAGGILSLVSTSTPHPMIGVLEGAAALDAGASRIVAEAGVELMRWSQWRFACDFSEIWCLVGSVENGYSYS